MDFVKAEKKEFVLVDPIKAGENNQKRLIYSELSTEAKRGQKHRLLKDQLPILRSTLPPWHQYFCLFNNPDF